MLTQHPWQDTPSPEALLLLWLPDSLCSARLHVTPAPAATLVCVQPVPCPGPKERAIQRVAGVVCSGLSPVLGVEAVFHYHGPFIHLFTCPFTHSFICLLYLGHPAMPGAA